MCLSPSFSRTYPPPQKKKTLTQVDDGDAAGGGLKPEMLVSLTAPKLSARCEANDRDTIRGLYTGTAPAAPFGVLFTHCLTATISAGRFVCLVLSALLLRRARKLSRDGALRLFPASSIPRGSPRVCSSPDFLGRLPPVLPPKTSRAPSSNPVTLYLN